MAQTMTSNVAIEATPDHRINVKEVPLPQPGPDECLIHVRATVCPLEAANIPILTNPPQGICGSDVHMW